MDAQIDALITELEYAAYDAGCSGDYDLQSLVKARATLRAEFERLEKRVEWYDSREHRLIFEVDELHKQLGHPSIGEMNPRPEETVVAGAVLRYAREQIRRLREQLAEKNKVLRELVEWKKSDRDRPPFGYGAYELLDPIIAKAEALVGGK